jgi:hypothetical protein
MRSVVHFVELFSELAYPESVIDSTCKRVRMSRLCCCVYAAVFMLSALDCTYRHKNKMRSRYLTAWGARTRSMKTHHLSQWCSPVHLPCTWITANQSHLFASERTWRRKPLGGAGTLDAASSTRDAHLSYDRFLWTVRIVERTTGTPTEIRKYEG